MMNFFRKRLNKKGFTLVELLIVIAVLGIIAGIGVNSMTGVTTTFKVKADEETAEMIARQVEIQVLAGTITSKKTTVTGIEYPNSQSEGTPFVATVAYTGTDAKVTVTAADGDDSDKVGFSTVIDIADKKVE